ncbi:hypothetical protein D9O50_14345 [Oxalobacteraceae bacterium CAVE-383]|nr:hypothetical protein D9O50_14345 [Oxalobacteraceae bacterium CAVE-383]
MPLSEPPTESSIYMVDSLAEYICESGEYNDCSLELGALVDIATYRNVEADAVSRQAEWQLLSLFSDPTLPPVMRSQIVDLLFESEAILMRGNSPDAKEFVMPASLKHLMAQCMHRQIASEAANEAALEEVKVTADAVHLEVIKRGLEEASGLDDEMDIADPNRFVTTDEMLASFAELPDTCGHVINLSEGVTADAAQMQMTYLLEKVPDVGVALAPLLVDAHFMLITAEKSAVPGKYALTIANTYLPISQAAVNALAIVQHEDALPAIGVSPTVPRANRNHFLNLKDAMGDRFAKQIFAKLSPALAGRVDAMKMVNNHLQAHALNSCGPLVSMMAENIAEHKPRGKAVGELMERMAHEWQSLEPQQQKDAVIAHRAKMIGHTVEWHRCGLPDGDRFIDSHVFLPRPSAQSGVSHP